MKRSLLIIPLTILLSTLGAQSSFDLQSYRPSGYSTTVIIEQGNTLYGIAQATGYDVLDILYANQKNHEHISLGESLIIPIRSYKISTTQSDLVNGIPLYYTVLSGDNLYRIATSAQLTTDMVIQLNDKTSKSLQIGERLLLGWIDWPYNVTTIISHSPIAINALSQSHPHLISPINTLHVSPPHDIPAIVVLPQAKNDHKIIKEKGIAFWDKEGDTNQELIVMHPHAKLNTDVVLYNPMLNREVKAKVVSELRRQSYANDISIVISPSVANALGALDKRFLVEITYIDGYKK